jgi:CheY-like chemotaxis protein
MPESRRFLAIAEDSDRLTLVANTLRRRFPQAVVLTCRESEPAIELARTQRFDAIVANTSTDLTELPLVENLRAATTAPIILMSTGSFEERALASGATRFLNVQRWLLIGTVVARVVGADPDEGE